MIEVNNLVKRYGDHTAVDHLSFKIEKGKIYGFLGPNGAGKSTTMNMITGYIASTEGTVTIDGHDILDEPEQAKKCIGYLPEMPPLYFDMTVGEYMNFVADLKKIPKDQKKSMVEEVMEMVKITDQVQKDVAASGITAGVVFVISMHTTTAIMINESLPCVEKDIELTLERLIPTDGDYVHTHMLPSYGTCSGNAPGHLKSMLCGNHCVLPVIDGKTAGGSAQDIYFVEFDGLKIRKYTVQIMGE